MTTRYSLVALSLLAGSCLLPAQANNLSATFIKPEGPEPRSAKPLFSSVTHPAHTLLRSPLWHTRETGQSQQRGAVNRNAATPGVVTAAGNVRADNSDAGHRDNSHEADNSRGAPTQGEEEGATALTEDNDYKEEEVANQDTGPDGDRAQHGETDAAEAGQFLPDLPADSDPEHQDRAESDHDGEPAGDITRLEPPQGATQGRERRQDQASQTDPWPATDDPAGDDLDDDRVDINHASVEELSEVMKGIGPKKAEAIVEYREKHGPFKTANDLLNVKGIGPSTLKKNEQFIKLSSK